MTNLQIIVHEAVAHKIYTEDEAIEMIEKHGELPLHTFQAWKKRGYTVKKGEKATIATKLWKFKTFVKENDDGEDDEVEKAYLYRAYLFTAEQVEKIA